MGLIWKGGARMNKSTNLIVRIPELDKERLRMLAEKRQMTMSELVLYLIRREIDAHSKKSL